MVVEVISGLLLGSMSDVVVLLGTSSGSRSPVSHLLTVLNKPIDWSEIKTPQGSLMAKFVSVPDLPSSDLLTHFPSCTQFIHDSIQAGGTVLVHCEHGISRSATITLAYLMKRRKIGFREALKFLQERKPDIRPNLGFQEQLKLWELMNCRLDSSCKSYRAYTLHQQAQAMKRNGYTESMQLSPNPIPSNSQPAVGNGDAFYKCRKCRYVLLSSESILQHELGSGESAFSAKNHRGNPTMSYFILSDTKQKLKTAELRQKDHPALTCESDIGSNEKEDSLNKEEVTVSLEKLELVGTDSLKSPDSSVNTVTNLSSSVMAEMSALRNKISTLRAESVNGDREGGGGGGGVDSSHSSCTSLFVEPIEWMGPMILGHVEGKVSTQRGCQSHFCLA